MAPNSSAKVASDLNSNRVRDKHAQQISDQKLWNETIRGNDTMAVDQDEDLELSRSDLSPEYVRHRVDDWVTRINDLYADIRKSAAAKHITVKDGAPTTMDEELMRRYGIPSRQLPTLMIKKGDGIIKAIPKGLWVIGANGRIDLFTSRGLYMLVDFAAEPFGRPLWKIYGPDHRSGVDFTTDGLFSLV